MYILPFTFSDHCFVFVRFQVLLFVQLRIHFIYCILFRGTLGYSAAREQEANLKAVQYLLIFDLKDNKLGIATKCTTLH